MYYNPYQNIQNPFQNTFQNPFQRTPGYSGQIIQVNGKAGAEALQMEANSSVYVQDSTQGNRIYLCMTDGAGYKTVRGIIGVFEEDQEKTQQETAIANIEERLKKVEDTLNGYASGNAKTGKSANSKNASNDQ